MPPAQARVEARLAVNLVVEVDRGNAETAEQGGGPGGQGKSPLRQQRTSLIVPTVGARNQGDVAEVAATRAQPARLDLGPDGAKLLPEPSVHRRRRDRVYVGPADAAVLERYRH